jgi:peptidyl-prolyl cis-trans isomerase SurA
MRNFKKLLLISALVAFAPLQLQAEGSKQAAAENIDRVAAVVNDEIITDSEVVGQINGVKHEFLAHGKSLPEDAVLRKKIVEQLVYKKLQMQVAKRADIKVEQEEMTRAIDEIAKRNHVDLATMRTQMEAQGVTYSQFRKDLNNQLLMQKNSAALISSESKRHRKRSY